MKQVLTYVFYKCVYQDFSEVYYNVKIRETNKYNFDYIGSYNYYNRYVFYIFVF